MAMPLLDDALPGIPESHRCGASLLRRLAHAVDGYRGAGDVVFAGPYEYNARDGGHPMMGPFPTRQAAREYLAQHGFTEQTHGIFGPFCTDRIAPRNHADRVDVGDLRLVGGVESHADTIPETQTVGAPMPRVAKVHVEMEDGRRFVLDGKEYDSVFWSDSARDKFLLPYYVAVGTLDEAIVLRDSTDPTTVLTHRPGSRWAPGTALLPETPEGVNGGAPAGARGGVGLFAIDLRDEGDGAVWVARPLD